ncbi:hypothetical protein CPB86DRAFT_46764 [Serendipita vermifera]|nr:hypothetical protein CPB86DRAFT_46764 [Serendipita vermifera]
MVGQGFIAEAGLTLRVRALASYSVAILVQFCLTTPQPQILEKDGRREVIMGYITWVPSRDSKLEGLHTVDMRRAPTNFTMATLPAYEDPSFADGMSETPVPSTSRPITMPLRVQSASPPPPSFVTMPLDNRLSSGPSTSLHNNNNISRPGHQRHNSSDSSDSDLERGRPSEERPREVRLLTTIARLPTKFGVGGGKGKEHSEHVSLLSQGSNTTLHPHFANPHPNASTLDAVLPITNSEQAGRPNKVEASDVTLAPPMWNKDDKGRLRRAKTRRIVTVGSWTCMILVGLLTGGFVTGVILLIVRFAVNGAS